MGWEDAGEALEAPSLPPLDPFPFTREGRLYEQLEHELRAAQAVLKVGALVLEKSAIWHLRQGRKRLRSLSPTG
jgi:hypothetical protein